MYTQRIEKNQPLFSPAPGNSDGVVFPQIYWDDDSDHAHPAGSLVPGIDGDGNIFLHPAQWQRERASLVRKDSFPSPFGHQSVHQLASDQIDDSAAKHIHMGGEGIIGRRRKKHVLSLGDDDLRRIGIL
jgi:hypothetical protein